MFAMGVCGFIIVALGTTLSAIAANVGYSAYDIGTVFVARGIGCITGTMMSSVLYAHYNGKHLLGLTSTATVVILYWMPYCTDYYLLHAAYFALGVITSVTETGSQLMMIKFHGSEAGPWCGANSMAFCVSGIIVPAVQMISPDLHTEYTCYAAFVAFSAIWVVSCPDPEEKGRIQAGGDEEPDTLGTEGAQRHYRVEVVVAVMIFLMIGGGEAIMFYLKIYVNDTDVIPSDDGALLFMTFFIAVTVGKLLGIADQALLTNETIVAHFLVLLVGSALSLLSIWWLPDDASALWLGIVFFGLCQGPAISYCFDLCNRLAHCSEVSISILMLGLNLGVSVVPYGASLLWTNYWGPVAIINVGIWTMSLCVPLLFLAPRVSYLKSTPYNDTVWVSGCTSQQSHPYSPVGGVHSDDAMRAAEEASSSTAQSQGSYYQHGRHVVSP